MKCPSCSAAADDDAAECPSCGLVFAKWRELQEKKKREAAALLASQAEPGPAFRVDPVVARTVAAAAVVLWLLGLALFFRHRAVKPTLGPVGEPGADFATMRDPVTGDLKRVPIRLEAPQPPQ